MKYLNQLILALIIGMVGFSSLHAQDIDRERMQRDINIMESVLEELFKSEWSSETNTGSASFTNLNYHNGLSWDFNKNNTVRGNYFPDYGTLFMITGSRPITFKFSTNEDATGYFSSASGSKSEKIEINRESIINRISEFLMDYGSTIKQLEPSNKVTVVFEANNIDQLFTIIRNDSLRQKVNSESIPSVSVSAAMRDLQAYRKGQISESSFSERLTINNIGTEAESERKLRIMSKILQTSFEDEEADNFEIDNINYLYLEGFGAIFEGEAFYGPGFVSSSNIALSKLRDKLKDKAEKDSLSISISSDNFSWSSDDDVDEKSPEEIKAAYDNFISTLKETIIDYGPTLSSVQPDENIMISLSTSAGSDIVPEQLELRIKKSVLENMDSGNMGREQAMQQIMVREY